MILASSKVKTMQSTIKLLFFWSILVNLAFSCEKITEKSTIECSSGKIIKNTCGGTVLQFIKTNEIIGETWDDFMVQQSLPVLSYSNCVLVGNYNTFIPSSELSEMEGDTIFFNYRKVEFFKIGGPWCDIGGLPKTLIEISEIFDTK
jgi:hypothetical protein